MTTSLGPVEPVDLPLDLVTLADYLGVVWDSTDMQGQITLRAMAAAALEHAELACGRDFIARRYRTERAGAAIIKLRPELDPANISVLVDGQPYTGDMTIFAEQGAIKFDPAPSGNLTIDWRTTTPGKLPAAVEAAIMLLVSHWWNRRDQAWQVYDSPYGVNALLRSAALADAGLR